MSRQVSVKSDFALHEVVALTGFSKHMLDYLAREGIFAPSGRSKVQRGLKRRYSYADVVLLRALNSICTGKGKIRHLRDALLAFRRQFGPISPGQRLNQHLFVQGDELCVYSPSEGGRQLRSGQFTLSFVVDLAAISSEIAGCVVVEASSRQFRLTPAAARKAEQERQRIWLPIKSRRKL